MFPKATVLDVDLGRLTFLDESSKLREIHAIGDEIWAMPIRVVMPMRGIWNVTHAEGVCVGCFQWKSERG